MMKKKTQKPYTTNPDNEPEMVNEPGAAYEAALPTSASLQVFADYSKGVTEPAEFTEEEFADLIAKAESGPFFTLEESDRDFEAWEKEYLRNHGIIK